MKKEDKFPKKAAVTFIVILILILILFAGDIFAYALTSGYLNDRVKTETAWHIVIVAVYIFTIAFVAGAEASEAVNNFIVYGGFALASYLSYLSCMRI